MPDLLAHVLIAYAVCTALSWRYGWLSAAYVTVGMAGAFIPDLAKGRLLVPDGQVAELVGRPFSWMGLHTAGGAALAVGIGVLLVSGAERGRVAALLGVGAATHLLADALLVTPTGRSYALLWPVTRWIPPTPGLYLSSEPTPTVVAGGVAAAVWYLTRRRGSRTAS